MSVTGRPLMLGGMLSGPVEWAFPVGPKIVTDVPSSV